MPITDITTARDQIIKHVNDAWNTITPPVPELFFPDKKEDLPDNAAYGRVTLIHADFEHSAIGGKVSTGGGGSRFTRFGLIAVQIFTPFGDGLTLSDTLSNIMLEALEGADTGSDQVGFRNARIEEIGQIGGYYQVNVEAEFNYDRVK